MSILHRQKAIVQMDLIAESGPIYMEIQTCTLLHNRVCWYTGSVGTECSCRSLGDSVNALKTVQSLFVFQYRVSSTREKPYCELKIREEVLLRNVLLSKPAQLCQNLTYKVKAITIMKNIRLSWDYKYEGFMQKWIPLFLKLIHSELQSLEWKWYKAIRGFLLPLFHFDQRSHFSQRKSSFTEYGFPSFIKELEMT